ncbi:polysaccharide deacetylase family protein [Candidatus Woesebacteria bacterium]|nr:polysaccharide deacetylase family protein [Candidatus Woesebacteria bacterium]
MQQKLGVVTAFVVAVVVTLGLYKFISKSYTSRPVPRPASPDMSSLSKIYGQVVYHGKRDKKQVALTFDADMTYGMEKKLKSGVVKSYYNRKVIDILEKEKVPATLFIAGLWAQNYPDITRNISQNPLFEIGNHSYSHPSFTAKCFNLPIVKNREEEFGASQEILTKVTGKTPELFRFPGGCFNNSDLSLAGKYRLVVVGWDVDSGDAFNKNKDHIVRNIERQTQNGSIIVMHMHNGGNAPETANALPEIINFLKGQGYEFIKAGELIRGLTLQ